MGLWNVSMWSLKIRWLPSVKSAPLPFLGLVLESQSLSSNQLSWPSLGWLLCTVHLISPYKADSGLHSPSWQLQAGLPHKVIPKRQE